MNTLFDIFNVRLDKRLTSEQELPPEQLPYGAKLEEQSKILEEAYNFVSELRKRGPKNPGLLPFQRGLMLNCRALPALFAELQEIFPSEEMLVCTMNINQDTLERFFGVIRAMGATHTSPNALQFKQRMRRYLLLQNPDMLIKNSSNNVEVEDVEAVNLTGLVNKYNKLIPCETIFFNR
jgi:hypothetical protein